MLVRPGRLTWNLKSKTLVFQRSIFRFRVIFRGVPGCHTYFGPLVVAQELETLAGRLRRLTERPINALLTSGLSKFRPCEHPVIGILCARLA